MLGGNHGQYLQAAGMKELINQLCINSSVCFAKYNNHIFKELVQQTRSFQFYKYLRMRYEWSKNFELVNPESESDLVIFGSDQIWNFSSSLFPADPFFFGGSSKDIQVSYAPSMGLVDKNFVIPLDYCKRLDNFEKISVRDYPSAEAIRRSIHRDVSLVIDPAFFLSRTLPRNAVRENVLSVYCPRSNVTVPEFVSKYSGISSFERISYYGYCPRSKLIENYFNQAVMPMDLLNRISASRFLLTSTFHGVVMALMTKTPFLAVYSKSLESRLSAPVFDNSFSKKRLIHIEKMKDINYEYLNEIFSDEDLIQDPINRNLSISKEWLSSAVSSAVR